MVIRRDYTGHFYVVNDAFNAGNWVSKEDKGWAVKRARPSNKVWDSA